MEINKCKCNSKIGQTELEKAIYFLKRKGSHKEIKKLLENIFYGNENGSVRQQFISHIIKNVGFDFQEIFEILTNDMFFFITEEKNLIKFAYGLQTLAELTVSLPNISLYHGKTLIDLSIIFIQIFSQFDSQFHIDAIKIFICSLLHLEKLHENFQREYFTSLFSQGIFFSSSDSLLYTFEIQKMETICESAFSYKNFVPLWTSLFKSDILPIKFIHKVFSEFVSVLIFFIETYTPSLKQENIFQCKLLLVSSRNSIFMNKKHFLNFIDLCIEIIEEVDFFLFEKQVEKCLQDFLKFSYDHPLVPEFYRLNTALFKKISDCNWIFESQQKLFKRYIYNVIESTPRFSEDLQLISINLILNAPVILLPADSDKMIKILNIAFSVGLNNFSLALSAFKILEIYRDNLEIQKFYKIVQCIFSNLVPYISTKFDLNTQNEIKNYKIISGIANPPAQIESYQSLQKKILLMLSSCSHNFLFNNLDQKISEKSVISKFNSLLSFKISFSNHKKIETHYHQRILLDECVKKINNFDDSEVKFSACEIFYSYILIALGNQTIDQSLNKQLLLLILKLGSESDDPIRNLYDPLVTQLILKLCMESYITSKAFQELVDILFEGLLDHNIVFVNYCRKCLKKIIQLSESNLDRVSCLTYLVDKIIHSASTDNKAIEAVTSFNYLYSYFDKKIIMNNWLKLFKVFVKILEKHDSIQLKLSIDILISIVCDNDNLLSKKNVSNKEIFYESLNNATIWLFNQWNSLIKKYRNDCMELFSRLFQITRSLTEIKLNFTEFIMPYFTENFEKMNTFKMKMFLRYLDTYSHIFIKDYFQPKDILVLKHSPKIRKFYDFFNNFTNFMNHYYESKNRTEEFPTAAKETKDFNYLMNDIYLKIFEFTNAVLLRTSEESILMIILDEFWTHDFCMLLSRFILYPQSIGFTIYSLDIIKLSHLEKLFETLTNKLPSEHLKKLRNYFTDKIMENINLFMEFESFKNSTSDIIFFKNFVRGITILRKFDIYRFENKEIPIYIEFEKELVIIFGGLKNIIQKNDYKKSNEMSQLFREYMKDVMEFFLIKFQNNLITIIINIITQDNSSNFLTILERREIFEIFRVPIYHCMLINPPETLKILNNTLELYSNKKWLLIEDILVFVKEQRRNYLFETNYSENWKVLAIEVLLHCYQCNVTLVRNNYNYSRVLNILKLSVSFLEKSKIINYKSDISSQSHLEKCQLWINNFIVQQFEHSVSLEEKYTVIEMFLGFFENQLPVQNLNNPDSILLHEKLIINTIQKLQSTQCFKILIRIMNLSKSWIIFKEIIKFCSGVFKILSSKNLSCLTQRFFCEIKDYSIITKIDEIYTMFISSKQNLNEQMVILECFLLPSLQVCNDEFFKTFYSPLTILLTQSHNNLLHSNNDKLKRKHNLVMLVGCFRISEIIFCKLLSNLRASYVLDNKETFLSFIIKKATVLNDFKCFEEKELVRLLHCAIVNCLIAIACSENCDYFFEMVFRELDLENIIDIKRPYNVDEVPTIFEYKSVSLRKLTEESLFDKYQSFHNSSKNIDLVVKEKDIRKKIKLEKDELNDHECMAMITTVIIHNFNRHFPQNHKKLPKWLCYFETAFFKKKTNVNIYLMRIISNSKFVFKFYIKYFFYPITEAICSHLETNAINYLVRDMLVILIDTKYVPKYLSEENNQCKYAQKTIEMLIDRAFDFCPEIFEYNIECIENLISLWKNGLSIPKNLNNMIHSNPYLAIRIILILFKNNIKCAELISNKNIHALVRNKMFSWLDPVTPWNFEVLGFILNYIPKDQRDLIIAEDIFEIDGSRYSFFFDIKRFSIDLCIHLFYRLTVGYPRLSGHQIMCQFVDPNTTMNSDRKTECYLIFYEAIKYSQKTLNFKSMEQKFEKILFLLEKLVPCNKKFQSAIQKRIAYEAIVFVFENFPNKLNELLDKYAYFITDVADPDIRDVLLRFWSKNSELPFGLERRLTWLFSIYRPEMHSNFPQFMCLMLLDLADLCSDDSKYLIETFAPDGLQENYEISIPESWNKNRKISTDTFMNLDLEEYCLIIERINADKKIFDLSVKKLSKRNFPPLKSYPNLNSSKTYISQCQRFPPRLNEQYLGSKFPIMRITQKSMVRMHKIHAKFDNEFATRLLLEFVSFSKLDKELESSLALMSTKAFRESNNFAPIAIEILYRMGCKKFNPDNIVKICKSMSCEALGILLLERDSILPDESIYPGINQKILVGGVKKLQHWVHLASLYHSIGDYDMVTAIFENWNLLESNNLRCSCIAESKNNWLDALKNYEEAYRVESGFTKNYCLEGVLRCMSKLSSWADINKKISTLINFSNLNSFDTNKTIFSNQKINGLIPWVITGLLQNILEELSVGKEPEIKIKVFSETLLLHLSPDLTHLYGNELSLLKLLLNNNFCESHTDIEIIGKVEVKKYLESFVEGAHRSWFTSSLVTNEPRRRILQKLQVANDLEKIIQILKSNNYQHRIQNIIQYWREVHFSNEHELLEWNKLVGCRQFFGNWILQKVEKESIESGIIMDLISAIYEQLLNVASLAFKFKNDSVFHKRLTQTKLKLDKLENVDDYRVKNLQDIWKFLSAQYKFNRGLDCNDFRLTFYDLSRSWQLVNEIIVNENAAISTKISAHKLVFKIIKSLQNLMQKNHAYAKLAFENDFIRNSLRIECPEQIYDELFVHSHHVIHSICQQGSNEEQAKNYMRLAEYYHDLLLENYGQDLKLQKEFTAAILTAMNLGSTKAIKYFSYLLNYSFYKKDKELSEIFVARCQQIPSWMFLFWQEQIVLHLTTPLKSFILPIFQRLVEDYPHSVIFSFKNVYETNVELARDDIITALYKSILVNIKIETFFRALQFISQPEQYILQKLQEFKQRINDGDEINACIISAAVSELFLKIFPYSEDKETDYKTEEFEKTMNKYRNVLEKLKSASNLNDANMSATQIMNDLNKSFQSRLKNNKSFETLQQFNFFQNDFIDENLKLEIPGQYSKFSKPLPHYHVKIIKFFSSIDPVVSDTHVHSKFKLIGTDGKMYPFLLKCGTDLRRNLRMQQIFKIVNEILQFNEQSKTRNLFLMSYNIVPLSKYMGFIEWIEDTKSVMSLIEISITDKSVSEIKEKYEDWINAATNNECLKSLDFSYKKALEKYTAKDVVSKMKELTAYLEKNLLQKIILQRSSSPDQFISFRRKFITSYATMSMIDWLIGAGNRTLDHTLIELKTGNCIGINYNIVFGISLEQSVPEIVPFRLTAQILGLMQPFQENDLFGSVMVFILSAVKKERGLFLSSVKMSINEPLHWYEGMTKQKQGKKVKKWPANKKFDFIKKKLYGVKPSNIMIDELSINFSDFEDNENDQSLALYKIIVNGSYYQYATARSYIKNYDLTSKEQVECLLDHATDVNVLGRMHVSWAPFI